MKLFWNKLHKIAGKLHLPNLPKWLCVILSLVVILRVPTFFEPYYYGDEMVYLTLGQGVRQGLTLYKDIHDNKPPLLYLAAAAAGNLFWFKVMLAFWCLATIVFFYYLSKRLFENNLGVQKVSTLIFALLTTLPLLEGPTVNSELFMIGFTLAAFLILLKDKLNSKNIFWAGFLLGIGTLFKIPAAFDAPVIVVYWTITKGLGRWKEVARDTLLLIAGFAAPLLLTFVYFFFKGALTDYIRAAFLQNIGYLSSFRPGDVRKPFIVRNAPLLFRALIVIVATSITYIFRKKISSKFVLFCIWTIFALFAITLSERPYPHYFIQAAAPVSFLLTMLFLEKSFEQSLAIIPLTVAFLVPVYYKFYVYPTTTYYQRFINFALGNMSKDQYFNSFDSKTTRNYMIADFLAKSSNPGDKVFIWDPASPTIYALSRRLPPIKYVVPYHIKDYSDTATVAKEIIANPPKFIIFGSQYYPELSSFIASDYILIRQIDGASIFVRLQNSL